MNIPFKPPGHLCRCGIRKATVPQEAVGKWKIFTEAAQLADNGDAVLPVDEYTGSLMDGTYSRVGPRLLLVRASQRDNYEVLWITPSLPDGSRPYSNVSMNDRYDVVVLDSGATSKWNFRFYNYQSGVRQSFTLAASDSPILSAGGDVVFDDTPKSFSSADATTQKKFYFKFWRADLGQPPVSVRAFVDPIARARVLRQLSLRLPKLNIRLK